MTEEEIRLRDQLLVALAPVVHDNVMNNALAAQELAKKKGVSLATLTGMSVVAFADAIMSQRSAPKAESIHPEQPPECQHQFGAIENEAGVMVAACIHCGARPKATA